MKIIHVSRYNKTGGAAIAGTRIFMATVEYGINSERLIGEDELSFSKFKSVIVQLMLYPIKFQRGLLSLNLFSNNIVKKINNSDADIVHLHWINDEMLSIEDISRINKPIIWSIMDMWPFTGAEHYTDESHFIDGYKNRPINKKLNFYINKWTWTRKKSGWKENIEIITPSKWLAEQAKSSDLMRSWNINVVPIPIDVSKWFPEEKKVSREALSLPKNKFLILFGAQNIDDPVKGFDLLEKTLNHLKDEINDFTLIMFGKKKGELKLKYNCDIIYLDFLSNENELRNLFSAVDVFVAPSRLEAFGQVASESQACGTPVVAYNNSGLVDVISHLETGYLAKSFDTEDFAEGIKWAYKNKKNKKQNLVSLKCRERVENNFSYKTIGKIYNEIYSNTLSSKKMKRNILHVNRYLSFGGAAEAFNRINGALSDNKRYYSKKLIGSIDAEKSRNILLLILFPFTGNIRSTIAQLLIKILMIGSNKMRSISIFPTPTLTKINNSDCDLVHLHWVNDEMISIEDIGKIKKPIVWTFHDMWPFCGAEHITESDRFIEGYVNKTGKKELGFDLDKWTWNRKKKNWKNKIKIVVPSHWLFNKVKQSNLMKNRSIKIIPNPIDTDTWYPESKEKCRQFLNLPQNITIILFGATEATDYNKGLDLLAESLDILTTQGVEFKCVIFGKINKLKLPKYNIPFIFLDYISDPRVLRSAYNSADVFVCPSRLETFGQTASESQACGTPVVAFNNSGLTEVIMHLKTGYLAKSFNTDDFANGIKWVLKSLNKIGNFDNGSENNIQQNARNYIFQNFSYSVISQKYADLYDEVISNLN